MRHSSAIVAFIFSPVVRGGQLPTLSSSVNVIFQFLHRVQ